MQENENFCNNYATHFFCWLRKFLVYCWNLLMGWTSYILSCPVSISILIHILSCLISIPIYVISLNKSLPLAFIQTFTDWFLSNFVWWWRLLNSTFSLDYLTLQGHSCMINKKTFFFSKFSRILLSIWMKFSMLPRPIGLLKLMLNLFCTHNIQGRELCSYDCIKYMFYIVLRQDTCELICFKLDARQVTEC